MALVNGPLFSLSASGSLANALVYSNWKGRDYVRSYAVPSNPNTMAQISQRQIISLLAPAWHYVETIGQTSAWQALADAENISLFNAYMKFNIDLMRANEAPQFTPTGTGNGPPDNEVDGVIWTYNPRSRTVDFEIAVDPAGGAGDMFIAIGLDAGPGNLLHLNSLIAHVQMVDSAAAQWRARTTPLVAGTYPFFVQTWRWGGTHGTILQEEELVIPG